jgi:hypothetical protein
MGLSAVQIELCSFPAAIRLMSDIAQNVATARLMFGIELNKGLHPNVGQEHTNFVRAFRGKSAAGKPPSSARK